MGNGLYKTQILKYLVRYLFSLVITEGDKDCDNKCNAAIFSSLQNTVQQSLPQPSHTILGEQ